MVNTCPSCGTSGLRVDFITLRALLKDEFLSSVAEEEYRFCGDAGCGTVYYSSRTIFIKSQLKVPVGVKEASGERPLCYCFGHSIASITEELKTKGCTNALEDIRAKMKDPGCRCEVENPSGSCCLGSVAKGIQVAQAELGVAPSRDTSPSSGRGERIAKIGTLVSAIMASACCWLPLVLLAVGVSGARLASTLEAYRPVFIVVTFGFLAAAFYYTYRPKCDADDCCAPKAKGRWNLMSLNKIMLWAVTAMAVVFLLFPSYVGVLLGTSDNRIVTENMNTALFKIEGMTCEGCVSIVEKAVGDVPGVLAVEVNYAQGQALVGSDLCCPVPADQISQVLQRVGYVAQLLKFPAEN